MPTVNEIDTNPHYPDAYKLELMTLKAYQMEQLIKDIFQWYLHAKTDEAMSGNMFGRLVIHGDGENNAN